MASEVKVELIHKETIKPSSPTPSHLKTTNLSVFYQLSTEIYPPVLLFYPPCSNRTSTTERSSILKTSLSKTLTHFYPFAGKFQYNDCILCDDRGARFTEARVNCPISKVLYKPDFGILCRLLPADITSAQAVTDHLLLVQANFFDCGGLAIGIYLSHKVADASTLSAFIKTWAATALDLASTTSDHREILSVEVGFAASLFPPLEFLNTPHRVMEYAIENCRTQSFVFHNSKIAALKSKAGSPAVPSPTRVKVLSALIWKCAMEASRSNLGFVRPSTWCQPVNLRKILGWASLEHSLGNLVGLSIAKTEESEVDDLQSLVAKLRKGTKEFKVKYGNGITGDDACEMFKELGNFIKRDDIDSYCGSSLCRFPFYDTNFGWGKPSWIFTARGEFKNLVLLMDTRDAEGIEAFLTFKEEDMAIIEKNEELLAYAS
ncbi:minovincinine 19-hydroxy-O-acetyltransferase-like [Pyrus communis]|uniref:minovincinine 19-hydroxy-O-acetyltransferase-like n=1 Tax=Pyrus communis TaxID=23211 RepID=UPI0035BEFA61